jgi:PhnB protein
MMTKLNPYLTFDGACEAAFQRYQAILGGEVVTVMRWKDMPRMEGATIPEGWADKVMHSELIFDGGRVMGSDSPPGQRQQPAGITVTLSVETPEEADRLFAGLAEGGTVRMPIGETFFSKRFGMLTDQFGIPWMIVCEARP